MKCPSKQRLAECLDSDLLDTDVELAKHISQCDSCQSTLDSLSDDDQLAQWRGGQPQPTSGALQEPQCHAVVQRMLHSAHNQAFERPEVFDIDTLQLGAPDHAGDVGKLANYRILRQLGQGGMAVVLEAIDTRLNRAVAIKVLRPDRSSLRDRERFVRETLALARVKHSNVVDIYDVADPSTGAPYYVTEMMQRGSLRDVIDPEPLDARLAAQWMAAVADGLQAAHSVGLIHRDIKPSNILLSGNDSSLSAITPKLADFGLARMTDGSALQTQTVGLVGTPAYMSPEQISTPQQLTLATDIYSLGVTLYEAICGELPFRGAPHAVMHQIVHDDPPQPHRFNANVPRELELICLKAMHREPGRRYASAAQLAEDLRSWLAGRALLAKPPTTPEKAWRWYSRNQRVAWLTGLVMTLMLMLTVGSWLAAWSILNSQAALKERTETAEQAQQLAQVSAEQAAEQRRITMETLNSLVGSVQSQLEKRPDTVELRQAILKQAFDGLDAVTRALDDETQVDHTMIDAHVKMSAIKLELGDRDAAISEAGKAIGLAERASASQPDDVERLRDWANALTTQFEIYFSAFANQRALEVAKRIVEIRQRVCDRLPTDAQAARVLLAMRQRVADLQWRAGDITNSLHEFDQLVKAADTLQQKFGDQLDLRRDKGILLNRRAAVELQTGNGEKASQTFQASYQLFNGLLMEEPANVVRRTDMAFVQARLATLNSSLGKHEEAVGMAQGALEAYRQLALDDPKRAQNQTLLSTAYDLLYQVLFAKEEFAAAIEAEKHAFEIAMTMSTVDTKTMRHPALAGEDARKIADAYMRSGQWDESLAWLDRAIEQFARTHAASDFALEAIEPYEKSVAQDRSALQLAIKGSAVCHMQMNETPYTARLALAMIAFEQARVQKPTETLELLDEIQVPDSFSIEEQAGLFGSMLRALVMCERCSAEADKSRIKKQMLVLVRRMLEVQPASRSYISSEPLFASLRKSLP